MAAAAASAIALQLYRLYVCVEQVFVSLEQYVLSSTSVSGMLTKT